MINEVYASPSNERNWGRDRLGTEVIQPGGMQIIRLPADGNCSYDILIVYQGGSAEERRNLDTCNMIDLVLGGGAAPQPRRPSTRQGSQQQGNPSFNLLNQSGRVIGNSTPRPPPSRIGGRTGWARRSCNRAPPSPCDCRRAIATTISGWCGRAASRRNGAT